MKNKILLLLRLLEFALKYTTISSPLLFGLANNLGDTCVELIYDIRHGLSKNSCIWLARGIGHGESIAD